MLGMVASCVNVELNRPYWQQYYLPDQKLTFELQISNKADCSESVQYILLHKNIKFRLKHNNWNRSTVKNINNADRRWLTASTPLSPNGVIETVTLGETGTKPTRKTATVPAGKSSSTTSCWETSRSFEIIVILLRYSKTHRREKYVFA